MHCQQRSNQPLCPPTPFCLNSPSIPPPCSKLPLSTNSTYKDRTLESPVDYPYVFSCSMQVRSHSLVLTLLPRLQEAVPAPSFRRLTDSTCPCQHWQCWSFLLLGRGGPCSADSGHLCSLCHPAWLLACQCFSYQSAYSGTLPLHCCFLPCCPVPLCHLPVCLFAC